MFLLLSFIHYVRVSNLTYHKMTFIYVGFIEKYKKIILLSALLLIVGLAYPALTVFSKLQSKGFSDPNSESTLTDALFSRYYKSPSPDIFAILSLHGTQVTDPSFNTAYFDMKEALISKIPEATSFISYFEYPLFQGSISEDGYKTFISFRLPDPSKYTLEDYQNAIYGTSLKVDFGGGELANQEIPKRLGEDLAKIEAGSIPVLLVLLVRR